MYLSTLEYIYPNEKASRPRYQPHSFALSRKWDQAVIHQAKDSPSRSMHSLARKLDVHLESKKQPSKKILVEAIVITKLKQLDPVDAKNYT